MADPSRMLARQRALRAQIRTTFCFLAPLLAGGAISGVLVLSSGTHRDFEIGSMAKLGARTNGTSCNSEPEAPFPGPNPTDRSSGRLCTSLIVHIL